VKRKRRLKEEEGKKKAGKRGQAKAHERKAEERGKKRGGGKMKEWMERGRRTTVRKEEA